MYLLLQSLLFFTSSSIYPCFPLPVIIVIYFAFSVHIVFSGVLCLIVSASTTAAMSSIKTGIPISILPYKLHVTLSQNQFTFAVNAQHIMGPYVGSLFYHFPYFCIFSVSIWCIYFDLRCFIWLI